MYKVCQTEQSSERQRSIEQGLLQLMLKRPYENISVSDLCENLQIPRKTFYRYFSGKDGALYALLDHTIAGFFEMPATEKTARGTALADLDLFFQFWYENRLLLDALQRSSLSGLLVERANAFALNEGLMPRKVKSWNPELQELAMAFAICGLMSMTLQWHHHNFQVSAQEMTQLATSILTNPLLSPI